MSTEVVKLYVVQGRQRDGEWDQWKTLSSPVPDLPSAEALKRHYVMRPQSMEVRIVSIVLPCEVES